MDGNNTLISECFFLEENFLISFYISSSCFTIFISHGCYTEHNRANNHQESLYIPIDTEMSEGKGISSSHGWLIHALISKRPIISSFKQPWQWHHLLTKAEVTANIHTHFCLIFIALRHFLLSYLFDICLLSTVIDFFIFFISESWNYSRSLWLGQFNCLLFRQHSFTKANETNNQVLVIITNSYVRNILNFDYNIDALRWDPSML